MSSIKCIYVSGASMIFEKKEEEEKSQFTICVLPLKDQEEKKEIIALTDSNVIRGGLFRRPVNNARDVTEQFSKWCNSNAESINKLSDFLKENLDRKEVKKNKKCIELKVNQEGAEGGYITEKEF